MPVDKRSECKAWVFCEGLNLAEYATEVDYPNITTFIPCLTDRCFELKIESPQHTIEVIVFIDGQRQKKFYLTPGKLGIIKDIRTGDEERRLLIFKPIQVTEDEDQGCSDPVILNGLGSLKLEVRRVEQDGERTFHNDRPRRQNPDDGMGFRERVFGEGKMKKITNAIGLGAPIPIPPPRYRDGPIVKPRWRQLDPDEPYVAFVFYYRSQDVIDAQDYELVTPKEFVGNLNFPQQSDQGWANRAASVRPNQDQQDGGWGAAPARAQQNHNTSGGWGDEPQGQSQSHDNGWGSAPLPRQQSQQQQQSGGWGDEDEQPSRASVSGWQRDQAGQSGWNNDNQSGWDAPPPSRARATESAAWPDEDRKPRRRSASPSQRGSSYDRNTRRRTGSRSSPQKGIPPPAGALITSIDDDDDSRRGSEDLAPRVKREGEQPRFRPFNGPSGNTETEAITILDSDDED